MLFYTIAAAINVHLIFNLNKIVIGKNGKTSNYFLCAKVRKLNADKLVEE